MTVPLECHNLSKSYGGVQALVDVSCSFPRGSVTGVIGMNGAGKTTLIRTIAQQVRGAQGDVLLFGQSIMGWPDYRVVRAGLAKTYQNLQLFSGMSVRQNLSVGAVGRDGLWTLVDPFRKRRQPPTADHLGGHGVEEAADLVGLRQLLDTDVSKLSYGHRKRVEFARALVTGPKVLMLDEPSSGLGPAEVAELADVANRLRERVEALVLVEHDLSLLFRVADRLVVMESGRCRFEGEMSQFSKPEDLRQLFAI